MSNSTGMNRNQALLRHFLAAIAYRTAKALRNAPPAYATFEAGEKSRTPVNSFAIWVA
jgi:hypothetical protein